MHSDFNHVISQFPGRKIAREEQEKAGRSFVPPAEGLARDLWEMFSVNPIKAYADIWRDDPMVKGGAEFTNTQSDTIPSSVDSLQSDNIA